MPGLVVFANLPVGLNPMELLDQNTAALQDGANLNDNSVPASKLVTSGVTPGSYTKVTVSIEGFVTFGAQASITDIAGLGLGVLAFLVAPTSATLAGAVTDETGTGSLVFATSPVLVTPNLGTPSAINLANATNLPSSLVETYLNALPTSLPGSAGQWWVNGGVLSKS